MKTTATQGTQVWTR